MKTQRIPAARPSTRTRGCNLADGSRYMARFKSPITQPGYRAGEPSPNRNRRFFADTLTRDEVMALVDGCNCGPSGLRDRALIVLLYRTGLRISEACNLRLHDIDLDRGTIRVRGTKTRTSDRTVGIGQMATEHLTDWLDVRNRELKIPPVGYVFCCISRHERGNAVKPAQIRQKLHRLSAKAQIGKRVHPHALRHTFASELADERVDIRIVSKALGHSNVAITDRYISHLNPTAVLEVMGSRD